MAREEKRVELRPIDEEAEKRQLIARIGPSGLMEPKEPPVRLDVPNAETKSADGAGENRERRNRQPGLEALIESTAYPEQMEETWGAKTTAKLGFPWGWLVLVSVLLAGGVVWSLTQMTVADEKVHEIRVAPEHVLIDDEKEEREAAKLIDAIHVAAKKYFECATIGSLVKMVRQPERVRPLMVTYYATHPLVPHRLGQFKMLKPVTLENMTNYWIASVEIDYEETASLLMEILPDGEVHIDWETQVCYQPMEWNEFATRKPRDKPMDFRVYVQRDNFFSHEFVDSSRWNCFRLTALNSDQPLFGYTPAGSALSQEMLGQLKRDGGRKSSMILRLVIPEGLQSHSGVLIEKIMSSRWVYLKQPASGS